ncbi:Transport protein particle (TRAPP) complex subunit, partial [Trachipleistophora hominis]
VLILSIRKHPSMSKVSANFVQFFSCGFIHHLLAQGTTDIKTSYRDIGHKLAPKLLEMYKIHQTNDLDKMLLNIKSILANLYSSKRSISITSDREYYVITESDPLLSRSGVKSLNSNNLIAGLIEGLLDANLFDCDVLVSDGSDESNPNQVYYLIKNRKGTKF